MSTTQTFALPERPGPLSSHPHPLTQVYRADIDGLRAVAILAVVLYHFGLGVPGGYVGVDIFFVISGFLITQTLSARPPHDMADLYRFWLRRLRRLLPAMLVVTAVTLALSVFVLMPTELEALGESAVSALLFTSNYLFLQQAGYFDAPSLSKPLLHTWSLAVEGQFYLAYATLLALVLRWMPGGVKWRGVPGMIAVLMLGSLALAIVQMGSAPQTAFYTLPARLWEFLAGALLALGVVPAVRPGKTRQLVQACGLALILWAAFTYDHNTRFPGTSALLPVLGAAMLIHSRGTGHASAVSAWLEAAPMRWLGKISYSLYLWHWPMLVLASFALGQLDPIRLMLLGAGVAAMSAWSYRYIEQPYNRWSVSGKRKPLLVGLLMTGLVSALATSTYLVRTEGLPTRLSSDGLRYAAGAKDVAPRAEDCHTISPDRVAADDLCPLGQASAAGPSFVVWGDSHAHALIGAFDDLARAHGVQGRHASRAACPPLLGVRIATQTTDDCVRFNEAMIAYLDRHAVQHVFLVARWSVYTGGHTPSGVETGPEPLLRSIDPAGGSTISPMFAHALDRTLVAIRQPGRTIHIVSGVPEARYHIPFSLARSTLLLGPHAGAIQPRRSDVETRQKMTLQAFARVAVEDDIRMVPMHDILCDSQACQIASQGRSLYRDADHLSAFGASVIEKPAFEPAFRTMEGAAK